jgi:hypothetical protein
MVKVVLVGAGVAMIVWRAMPITRAKEAEEKEARGDGGTSRSRDADAEKRTR